VNPIQSAANPASARHIAVVGAGLAGTLCAQALAAQGHALSVFEKSRGVGGRLATRRSQWTDAQGRQHALAFDHGAPAFVAQEPAFQAWCEQAARRGWLRPWAPRLAPDSANLAPRWWLPVPDMPALCREQARAATVYTHWEVIRVSRDDAAWCLHGPDGASAPGFDQLLLAMPPAQAAALLQDHRWDWTLAARQVPMQACWTLMALGAGAAPDWDLARPTEGPVAWAAVNSRKPGRAPSPLGTPWVVHATAAWSETHLEADADEVCAALQAALEALPGVGRQRWHWAAAHRWRYANWQACADVGSPSAWWDSVLGLGVCGDWLGGGGVNGAWASARALLRTLASTARLQPADTRCATPS
jgi:renalase